ncbi:3-phosphoserine/phosphohydroxythreonine transaminase [Kangiella sediminilitoris]|uniref:Phosphoserine aminotransferase n=1 Tax=Kangiella sediminilitoris TaxID=1144748 RepID=A0A1B3BBQ8_9GAMM|nr:3-phosphoserine/phosphohydroxythreonine transaminase [Kangiella sediminilitoris]AOE50197.1 Phosphoserine aminotransferase [Kangiella sediminilitoris]
MTRAFNFSAGPAAIPTEVLERAQEELLNWQGYGCSVMELGHRTPDFKEILHNAEKNLRKLLNIPSNYKVLFMHGSASHQFSMVPMNFLRPDEKANYLELDHWSKMCIAEAKRFANVHVEQGIRKNKDGLLELIPEDEWELDDEGKYLHFTSNETIVGIQFEKDPSRFAGKLVSDMCSDILSRPIDIEKYALIYAGAQKNIGPSGMTVVIVREDLFDTFHTERVPKLFQYPHVSAKDSMPNTPPSFGIYFAGLVFEWLLQQGGVEEMHKLNLKKANMLYDYVDQSSFYHSPVAKGSRSFMNVSIQLADKSLEQKFLEGAQRRHLIALKGHRSFGGLRASIYNAMSVKGVNTLIDYMKDFEKHL